MSFLSKLKERFSNPEDDHGKLDEIKIGAGLYRDFLYLDVEQTLDSLAALEGGDVEEVQLELVSKMSLKGGLGVKSATPLPIEASIGGEKSKQKTERMLLRRHVNAAITRVLFALTNSKEMSGLVDIKSGSIVAFGGESVLLPIGPPLDGERHMQAAKAPTRWERLLARLHLASRPDPGAEYVAGGVGERFYLLAVPDAEEGVSEPTVVVLDCERDLLRLRPHEIDRLTGPLTLVGKVERVEKHSALFEVREGRMSLRFPAERDSLPEQAQLLRLEDGGKLRLGQPGVRLSAGSEGGA